MPCTHRAVLIVTHAFVGTSTNVASERKNLSCAKEAGHAGLHRDAQYDESWKDDGKTLTHILVHEEQG
jgi:Zn-dependent peptidase ImmA (M78 family)